jgi:hypothetical protein
MIAKALSFGLGRLPLMGIALITGLVIADDLDALFKVEPKREEDRFDRFETALRGALADDKVNQSEIKFLNGFLTETNSISLPKLDLPKPKVKAKTQLKLVSYSEEQAEIEPVKFTASILELVSEKPNKIDKSEALKILYRAVAADGKVNKQEIAELRKLMAA